MTKACFAFFGQYYTLGAALHNEAEEGLPSASPELGEHPDLELINEISIELTSRGEFPLDETALREVIPRLASNGIDITFGLTTLGERLAEQNQFRFQTELALSNVVDNFQTYLSELLAEIFTQRPQMLRVRDLTISFAEILEHESLTDLISYMAEKRVQELSYESLRTFSKKLEKETGFALFKDPELERQVFEQIERRNLLVHNRGKVNRIYLKKVPGTDPRLLGKRLPFDPFALAEAIELFAQSVADIDERAATKFALMRIESS